MTGKAAPARLVVVGGGFCGAAFAIHLLRDHPDLPVSIDIVEPRPLLGAGLAYGTIDPTNRVNVSATRMSLFAETPDHFEAWLDADGRISADDAAMLPDGRRYPRRALYGAYVADTLRQVAASGVAGSCRHVRDLATGASRRASGGYDVRLSRHAVRKADLLLLATGHPPPRMPSFLAGVPHSKLVADPWAPDALAGLAASDEVLVVGTGLTACDVVASLRARGHRGRITAVSRRGLLPRPRTTRPVSPFGDFETRPSGAAIDLLRAVRVAVRDAAARDRPWEDVIDALRAQAGTVWNALPFAERTRLLRHLRPFWDVHRFQSAPQIDRAVADARADGGLRVLAASVVSVAPVGAELRVGSVGAGLRVASTDARLSVASTDARLGVALRSRQRRDKPVVDTILVDRVIDCTGPGHRTLVETSPFLADLAIDGLVRPDETRLGLLTDGLSRAIDRAGRPVADLFVLGPPARAAHGELMGLPQVSAQPRSVARHVACLLRDAYAARPSSGAEATRNSP